MPDDNRQLIEARRLINELSRVCRQVSAYFEGVSVMDEPRIRKVVREAIRDSERFLNS